LSSTKKVCDLAKIIIELIKSKRNTHLTPILGSKRPEPDKKDEFQGECSDKREILAKIINHTFPRVSLSFFPAAD
jgi:hypothetical protein